MEIITAISNAKIQYLKKLSNKKAFRYDEGMYIAEGERIVNALPECEVEEIIVTKDKYEKYRNYARPVTVIGDKAMKAVSDTESPQGVMAIARIVKRTAVENEPCIVLDNIADPGNMGTIIRTAAACGVRNISLYGNTCDPYSPKVVRASMGGIIGMAFTDELPDNLYVLDMGGKNIFEIDGSVSANYGLVVGNEARGVSKELIDRALNVISLPMSDRIESLNAGVSLSIALYVLTYGKRK